MAYYCNVIGVDPKSHSWLDHMGLTFIVSLKLVNISLHMLRIVTSVRPAKFDKSILKTFTPNNIGSYVNIRCGQCIRGFAVRKKVIVGFVSYLNC